MPIVTIGNSTQILFGVGDIEVAHGLLNEEGVKTGVLVFMQKEEGPIGVKNFYEPNKQVPIEETPVRFLFTKKESINAIIRQLLEAKKLMDE